jgi:hypothetical protein
MRDFERSIEAEKKPENRLQGVAKVRLCQKRARNKKMGARKNIKKNSPLFTTFLQIVENTKWKSWIEENIQSIEIVNEKSELTRIYFLVPEKCKNLREESKEKFLLKLKRDSPTSKVSHCFCDCFV